MFHFSVGKGKTIRDMTQNLQIIIEIAILAFDSELFRKTEIALKNKDNNKMALVASQHHK